MKWLRTGGNASLALGWQQKREPLQSLGQHQGSLADLEQEGLWGSSRMSSFCLSMEASVLFLRCTNQLWLCLLHR